MTPKRFPPALLSAFYSRSFYRSVCREWNGLGMAYLAFLLAVTLLPVTLRLWNGTQQILHAEALLTDGKGGLSDVLDTIAEQTPVMTLKNGELSIDAQQPYVIRHPETEEPLMTIDTTDGAAALKPGQAGILLTKKSIQFSDGGDLPQQFSLLEISGLLGVQHMETVIIDRGKMRRWMQEAVEKLPAVPWVFYVIKFFSSFIAYSIQIVFMAGGGLLMMQSLKLQLPFAMLIRLSAVAATPMIVLDGLTLFLGMRLFLYQSAVYFVLHGLFFYFALESNKAEEAR